jgi:hypothetical protein
MTEGIEHHLEQAEHAQHHAHDPFDRRVAMTMAILAAVLAGVTMASHRAHNETLNLHIRASANITEASDKWGYYQAKKNRQYMFEADASALSLSAKDAGDPMIGTRANQQIAQWKETAATYKKDADDIKQVAENFEKASVDKLKEAEAVHHKADRFDYGHLGLDLALVLCSVAVLTKQRGFWITGSAIGIIGAIVAASGFLAH